MGAKWQPVRNLTILPDPMSKAKWYVILQYILQKYFLNIPKIEPINVKQYEFKQSPYPQADKLPFRSIIVSASQGGKGILIQNVVSPTAHIDEAYKEIIR